MFGFYLSEYDLSGNPRFAAIPSILVHGSELGIPHLAPDAPSFYDKNRDAAPVEAEAIAAKVRELVARGAADGPYSAEEVEAALGPCQASALKVVPKTTPEGQPQKWRLVEDFSGPYRDIPAGVEPVNEQIDSSAFPCRSRSFREVAAFFRKTGADPRVSFLGLDFENGFEHVPVAPAVKHRLVIQLAGAFYIRHMAPFGLRSTPGEFGNLVDASLEILERRFAGGVEAISHVDDLSIALKDRAVVSHDAVVAFLESLGWRINEAKTELPTRRPTHIGCIWDVDAQIVSIRDDKRLKYIRKLEAALAKGMTGKSSLDEIDSLVGSLQYVTMVRPDWRFRLRRIYRCRALYQGDERARRSFTHSELRDLEWWLSALRDGVISSSFATPPQVLHALVATDASNEALGVYIKMAPDAAPMVAAYDLDPEWRAKLEAYIGNAEAWAVEAVLDTLVLMDLHDILIEVLCDNSNVVDAWLKGWSHNVLLNLSIARLLDVTTQAAISLRIDYIPTGKNPADDVSRDVPVEGSVPLPEALRSPRPYGTSGGRDPFSLPDSDIR